MGSWPYSSMSLPPSHLSFFPSRPCQPHVDPQTQLLGAMSSGTLPPDDKDCPTCSLCLFPEHIFISPLVTVDSYSEQYSLEIAQFDERSFHTQCAQFWQLAVGESLSLLP